MGGLGLNDATLPEASVVLYADSACCADNENDVYYDC